ncbi:MAG: hypothetical protein U5R31_14625 [Acidimicrobiia bacterium]|nr:hypothetical protein [Acidimicrobiia bacterium]
MDDYNVLLAGEPDWSEVLEVWEADMVLWDSSEPLSEFLVLSDGWQVVYTDDDWLAARRRS